MADFLFKGIAMVGYGAYMGVRHARFTESTPVVFTPGSSSSNDIIEIVSKDPGGKLETYRLWDIWQDGDYIILDSRIHARSSAIDKFFTSNSYAKVNFEDPDYYDKTSKWQAQSSSTYPWFWSYSRLNNVISLIVKHTFDDEIVKKIKIHRKTGEKSVQWWCDNNEWYTSRPLITQRHVLVDNSTYGLVKGGRMDKRQFQMRITTGSIMSTLAIALEKAV